MANKAVILIPDDDGEIQIDTNGVSYVKIITVLKGAQKLLSQQLVKEGEKIVGKDYRKLEKWLNDQIKKEEDNSGNISLN